MVEVEWVKIPKYCELVGDTVEAVKAKIKRGLWAEEKHYRKAADGRIYISLREVSEWIAKSKHRGG